MFDTSFFNGVENVNVFCFVPNVVVIAFNDVSTFDLIAYTVKSGLFIIVEFQSAWKFVGFPVILAYVKLVNAAPFPENAVAVSPDELI